MVRYRSYCSRLDLIILLYITIGATTFSRLVLTGLCGRGIMSVERERYMNKITYKLYQPTKIVSIDETGILFDNGSFISCLDRESDRHIMYDLLESPFFNAKEVEFKEISLQSSPAGFYFNNFLINCVYDPMNENYPYGLEVHYCDDNDRSLMSVEVGAIY